MVLEEAINKLIRDSVNLILVIPGYAIKAEQKDAPRPIGPYGTVTFVTDISQGWEQRTYEDNTEDPDITETIEGNRKIMMSLFFYRDNSTDNARKVRTGVVRESIQSLFRQAGIGLTSRSEVRAISEPLENGWEDRSQFDIVLNAVGSDTDIITSIASVDISGLYEANGSTYNFNIEV